MKRLTWIPIAILLSVLVFWPNINFSGQQTHAVTLRWESRGGECFRVYRGMFPGLTSTVLSSCVSEPVFTDTSVSGGVTHYYAVSAMYDGQTEETPKSNEVSITVPQDGGNGVGGC